MTTRNNLLERLGLFVRPQVLRATECARVLLAMRGAPAEAAQVSIGDFTSVDNRVRHSLSVEVAGGAAAAVIDQAFDAVRSELERYFGAALGAPEPPHFLLYGPGAYFVPHRDRAQRPDSAVATRRISAVLFLNDDFSGGALTFYDLMSGPGWEGVGLPCDAAPGLLIAFQSEVRHEVPPITAGERATVVTWFPDRPPHAQRAS